MYNIEEVNFIKEIYKFIRQNTKNNIPTSFKLIAEKFNFEIAQAKHFVHLLHYKYDLPILLKFRTIKDEKTNKTLCHFCKKVHGISRLIKSEIEITTEGTKLPVVFVCDNCYEKIIKK